jgi:Zn-dependent protease with chaperone function
MAAPRDARDRDPLDPDDEPKTKKAKGKAPRDADEDAPKTTKAKSRDDEDAPKARKDKSRDDEDDEKPRARRDDDRKGSDNTRDKKGRDDDEPRRKPAKLGNRKVPYPPPPEDVPDDLTEYAESYVKQENRLLIGLFLFLSFYIGAVLFCALMLTWCVWSFYHYLPFKVAGLVFFGVFLLFLIKGFFKRSAVDREMAFEITEDEHPVLFEFIYRLCEEVDAPLPRKVLVAPDVNAMCITNVSVLSLFREPEKDLLIGLGLVNAINMSEFKAILAHEFGHFCQAGSTRNFTYVAQTVIIDMIRGEDWFDRWINNMKRSQQFRGLGLALGGPLWLWRELLTRFFNMIALQSRVVSREQEFHADLVAVSAAGSDAATTGLLRARFGMECLIQAVRDLVTAMDHKMYSTDLYLHQARAATVVRRKKKDPAHGLPPAYGPGGGRKVRVFDAEQDALEDEDLTPPMWRSHPPDADREENAKRDYVAAPTDHRSPWILFDKPADLRERMTYKFYRQHRAFRIPKNADLTDAQKVQTFIDNEHSDTTYDPKYNGIYDDRPLEPVAPNKDGTPGDLGELNQLVVEKPWTDERIEKVLEKLYEGCRAKAEELDELRKERALLDNTPVNKKSKRLKQKIAAIDEKLDTLWEWLRSLDRRVYLIHVQMAGTVDRESKTELIERYRFQLEVQQLYSKARYHQERAFAFARLLFSLPPDRIHPELGTEVMSILREAWRALKRILQDAREINLPAMKNFEEGENLADFILEGKMVPEPPLSYVKLDWCQKLVDQLNGVRTRCFRLHCKSLGGILALQERVTAEWRKLREPVAAEVFEPEPVAPVGPAVPPTTAPPQSNAAVTVPAEPLPVEDFTAEVVPDDIPVEVIAEVVPVEPAPLPPPPAPAPARPEPMHGLAAFVTPTPVAPAAPSGLHKPAPAPAAPVPPPPAPTPAVERPTKWVAPPVPVFAPAPVSATDVPPTPPPPVAPVEIRARSEGTPAVVTDQPEPAAVPAAAPDRIEPAPAEAVFDLGALAEPEPAHPAPQPAAPEPAFDLGAPADSQPIPTPASEELAVVDPLTQLAKEAVAQAARAAAPAPEPVGALFSLDADEIRESAPVARAVPEPAKPAPEAPASVPAAEPMFSLDASELPARSEDEPVEAEVVPIEAEIVPAEVAEIPAEAVVTEEPVFSLDADDHRPVRKPVEPPGAAVGGSGAVTKHGSAPVPVPADRVQTVEHRSTPPASTPALSGITRPSAARSGFGAAKTQVKPAEGKRPPLRITLVRPGERSPLG